jgi:hypothetical protein
MFKISILETPGQRRVVLEGKLVPPGTAELETAWRSAGESLQGRKLIIDLRNVTFISQAGENTLFNLMRDGAEFLCGGVLNKYLVKKLARKCQCET